MKRSAASDWNYMGDLNQEWPGSIKSKVEENTSESAIFEAEEELSGTDESEIFIEHMDIREPIYVLR